MTKDYTHYVFNDGSTKKISSMTEDDLGKSIYTSMARIKANFMILKKLHERWGVVKKKETPNTEKKISKLLGIRKDVKEGRRAKEIVKLALKMLDDESDLEVIRNILRQVEV